MICHLTGTEFQPKVTTHVVCPSTLIGLLSKGFNLMFEGSIFSVRFHFCTCCRLQILTKVYAMTFVRVLFTMTSTLKSLLLFAFGFFAVEFAVDILKRLTLHILSSISFIWYLFIFIYLFDFCLAFTEFIEMPPTLAFMTFGVLYWTVWFVFLYLSIDGIYTFVAHSAFVLLDSIFNILFGLLFLQ